MRALIHFGLALAALGCRGGDVVRVIDGVEVRGAFVSEWAYAAYAVGAESEARERFRPALAAYLQAVANDPDSVELWSRIGALLCLLDEAEDAHDSFDNAESIDPSYEPLWRFRALCAERQGDMAGALDAATRAVAQDPLRDDTVLLYARLMAQKGDPAQAWPWLRALVLRSPASLDAWEAVSRHAPHEAWKLEAARRIAALRRALGPTPRELQERPSADRIWQAVDDALTGGDVAEARRILRAAHFDVRLLGARALLVGKPGIALAEASRRLSADPSDGDARAVLLLAADLSRDPAALERGLDLSAQATAPSSVGVALVAELLLRHAGTDAARAWLGDGVSEAELTVSGLRARAKRLMEQTP